MSKLLGALVGAVLLLVALVFVASALIMVSWNVLAPAFGLPSIDFVNAIGATVLLMTIRSVLGLGGSKTVEVKPSVDPKEISAALDNISRRSSVKVD